MRRTLRHTLGTAHRDYQKLRLSRSSSADADELDSVEQVEGLAEADSSGIGEGGTVRSEPLVVKTPAEAEDKGNGKAADLPALLQPTAQPTPPAGG